VDLLEALGAERLDEHLVALGGGLDQAVLFHQPEQLLSMPGAASGFLVSM
jgi:hypothetical protein